MKKAKIMPGDLILVPDPTGKWRLCEVFGNGDSAGWGDVVFPIASYSGRVVYLECRNKALDSLIGSAFPCMQSGAERIWDAVPNGGAITRRVQAERGAR